MQHPISKRVNCWESCLLTDGRDNSQDDPLNQSIRLGLTGIPVYPILIGSERRPKDLSIASLDFPQTAFKDDKVVLKAAINTSGFENEKIDVELRTEGEGAGSPFVHCGRFDVRRRIRPRCRDTRASGI